MTKRAELHFVLESKEDELSLYRALKADAAYNALYKISMLLREHDKYGQIETDVVEYISSVRSDVRSIIIDSGIDLDSEFI